MGVSYKCDSSIFELLQHYGMAELSWNTVGCGTTFIPYPLPRITRSIIITRLKYTGFGYRAPARRINIRVELRKLKDVLWRGNKSTHPSVASSHRPEVSSTRQLGFSSITGRQASLLAFPAASIIRPLVK